MKETRYDVSYLISNGCCAFSESKTFIDKPFKDVMDFLLELEIKYSDKIFSVNVFEGWGFNQRKLSREELVKLMKGE